MDQSIAARASRITPQEWRVIALSIEGVPAASACEALGIAAGTLESHKQAIRRKLGIPKGERFEAFVREHFATGIDVPDKGEAKAAAAKELPVESAHADRRVRWLLRITLEEMAELGAAAGLRAQLLEQTVARMGSDNAAEAEGEVDDLKQISEDLRALQKETLDRIRARAAKSQG
jgi:DNA-binding CsgD family transcriptional regulator